jgi:hypothetical protein
MNSVRRNKFRRTLFIMRKVSQEYRTKMELKPPRES